MVSLVLDEKGLSFGIWSEPRAFKPFTLKLLHRRHWQARGSCVKRTFRISGDDIFHNICNLKLTSVCHCNVI